MTNDFFFDFPGFHGARSKCHIRILHESGKPLIIICSQLPGFHGTSIMNAFEILYRLMKENIEKSHKENKKKVIVKKLDDYSSFILETKSIIKATLVFVMKEAKKY